MEIYSDFENDIARPL